MMITNYTETYKMRGFLMNERSLFTLFDLLLLAIWVFAFSLFEDRSET